MIHFISFVCLPSDTQSESISLCFLSFKQFIESQYAPLSEQCYSTNWKVAGSIPDEMNF
jgi:hypothetical protein